MRKVITIRFYEELNDLIPRKYRKKSIPFEFFGQTTIKDIIESYGVPHTEVDLIIANGTSEIFEYKPENGDLISVYPVFESIDISPIVRLRPEPLREPKFILDVHLGKLARFLRLYGFDTLYKNDYPDPEIIKISQSEKRIILTRDLGILKQKSVTHGYFIRSQNPKVQLEEVLNRFDLREKIKPLSRCIDCNGTIGTVDKKDIVERLQPRTRKYFNAFFKCADCGKVYWEGSHFENMKERIKHEKLRT